MTEPYWFWLTFPGGVVIGLTLLSPFLIGAWIYGAVKAARKRKADAERYASYLKQLRELRERRSIK